MFTRYFRCFDFSTATDDKLSILSQACDPATFGLNHEDVLDESYRKAGKLDGANFASTFDLQTSGLLHIVSDMMLMGRPGVSAIRAERYKSNVYGEHLPSIIITW